MVSHRQLNLISQLLVDNNITLGDLLCTYVTGVVQSNELTGHAYTLRENLCQPATLNNIVHALISTPKTAPTINLIARNIACRAYALEINKLLTSSAGFHFNVAHASPSQFHGFSSMKMAKIFEETCPSLWQLFGVLLNAVSAQHAAKSSNKQGDYLTKITHLNGCDFPASIGRNTQTRGQAEMLETVEDMPDEDWGGYLEDDYWLDIDEEPGGNGNVDAATGGGQPGAENTADGARKKARTGNAVQRQLQRTHVRRIALFSICMSNSNMRCNALQAVTGFFLHSMNTPAQIVELFSRVGLSIAPLSIDRMVQSMSIEARKALANKLATLLWAVAYDNLEVRFDTEQPTATNNGKLVSLTTATLVQLCSGISKADLRLCQAVWARSEFNLNQSLPLVTLSHDKLMRLVAKASFPADHPDSIESLFAWHARDILLNDNLETIPPALKEKFRRIELGAPSARRVLPATKTTQIPLQTMNICVSSTSGNAAAISNMLAQGGARTEDLESHVILVHGDLGTGEKIRSLQQSRQIEDTAVDRLQFLVFINGWFHTRMAMADSLWQRWIEPDKPRTGHATHPHSIFHLCTLLRPREIGKISSNPGFRRTHSLIEHLMLATIADAWRLVVATKFGVSLTDWTPNWDNILAVSREVVRNYVTLLMYDPTNEFEDDLSQPDSVQDQIQMFNRDGLLYLATTRASRYGDIQRVEDLLPFWVYIWRHTKKHKYATYTTRFLTYLDEGWPAKLSEIVRRNWLANPTGKRDGFRGVDWVVERNNYMHKCLHSGSGVNRTLDNLIKESPLIKDYQAVHGIVEDNFYLTPQTIRHPPPVVKTNLAMLRRHLEGEEMNIHHPGRPLNSTPVNAFVAGMNAALDMPGKLWFSVEDGAEEEAKGGAAEEDARPEQWDLSVDE